MDIVWIVLYVSRIPSRVLYAYTDRLQYDVQK